jgi:hypothetical protein
VVMASRKLFLSACVNLNLFNLRLHGHGII